MNGFMFGAYQVRKATEQDRAALLQWIAADPDHRDRVASEFFFAQEPGIESMVIERAGEPIFFFRLTRAVRVDMQFPPASTRAEKAATGRAFVEGFEWLLGMAQESGHRQMIFDSRVESLATFCKTRFGFEQSPHELVCAIASPIAQQEQDNSARE